MWVQGSMFLMVRSRSGFLLSRSVELVTLWGRILKVGPICLSHSHRRCSRVDVEGSQCFARHNLDILVTSCCCELYKRGVTDGIRLPDHEDWKNMHHLRFVSRFTDRCPKLTFRHCWFCVALAHKSAVLPEHPCLCSWHKHC